MVILLYYSYSLSFVFFVVPYSINAISKFCDVVLYPLVSATLLQGETISLPLPESSSRDEQEDMIWSIVIESDAQALLKIDGNINYYQTLEFGSGVWNTVNSIEVFIDNTNQTFELLLPWSSFWIRYRDSNYYYSYDKPSQLTVTAVDPYGMYNTCSCKIKHTL